MRRCPKCNRTFETDTQKFCTHDGGLLFAIDAGLSETVQLDSTKIRDAVAKPTTRDLEANLPAQFDPEATVITSAGDPEATIISSAGRDDATVQVRVRDTGELAPQVTQHHMTPPAAVPSGPIAPAQTSAPLPPAQPPSSGAIGTSAPRPAQQVAPQQPSPPLAAPPKKKSKVPLILGILAVLFVLGIGVVIATYLVWARLRPAEPIVASEPSRPTSSIPLSAASPAEASAAASETAPYSPPADALQFVSSKEGTSEKLAPRHFDFSFYYPNRWEKDAKAGTGDSANFVEVHRQLPPNFTQESMAVSWYDSAGSLQSDQSSFPSFAEKKSAAFEQSIDSYRKISEGPTKIGIYEGYEFRFEGLSQSTERGQFKIWGRVVWLPPADGGKTGATLLMLTTSLAPELKSAQDVGQKGELPMLLESFRFGKK
jgi:hypothetical protein